MFVIELVYKADLREIDAHMGAHVRLLERWVAHGAGSYRLLFRNLSTQ